MPIESISTSEKGATLLSFTVGLGLAGMLLTLVILTFQQVFHVQQQIEAQISVMDALLEVEDFYRKELGRLQFAPYCPSLLPSYRELLLGGGMAEHYRDRLLAGVVISQRSAGVDPILDLLNLKGHGSATYEPIPPKNISRLLNGADLLYINGLFPSDLQLKGAYISGDYDSDLIGLRRGKFYITDCRNAILVEAERDEGLFRLDKIDFTRMGQWLDKEKIQIYLYKEYLIYLQVRDGVAQLVVDYLDGQAFLRIPYIVDMRLERRVDGLSVRLVSGILSHRRKNRILVAEGGYRREFLNSKVIRSKILEVKW